ncbi:DUF7668 domain-containing protein [Idiomarina xiamenensis]|uniref:DUF7668 domain-containing protein n=1 Tax=Idiomarina xiamenensis 10-D-4 TaxID=740709 RepID=K2LCS7_9GAMM|nr:hypothetical protein [Idiomarina xiamenensis]EKE87680.1 hypothetical protein A10D4_01270 [Idiomarina xiamenensis 10-D-4]
MLTIATAAKTTAIKQYCQHWLGCVAIGDFSNAQALIDKPNEAGRQWSRPDIQQCLTSYFGDGRQTPTYCIDNRDIDHCQPCFMERDDGGLLCDFNLPVNDQLTDLTVQFEFKPTQANQFEVTIHDIHVL